MGDKKRYRLLKDYSRPTHVIRSGTEGGDNHWKNVFPELLGIDLLTLPDWFQPIEDKPEQKEEITEEFRWDEALIEEFIMTENCGYSIQLLRKQIAAFKKSRLPKTKEPKSFTEEDMRQARIGAFNAAREWNEKTAIALGANWFKFSNIESYLNSLNQPSKP